MLAEAIIVCIGVSWFGCYNLVSLSLDLECERPPLSPLPRRARPCGLYLLTIIFYIKIGVYVICIEKHRADVASITPGLEIM